VVRWLSSKFLSEEEKRQVGIITANLREQIADDAAEQPQGEATGNGAQVIELRVRTEPTPGQTALNLSPRQGGAFTFKMEQDGAICGSCGWTMIRSGTCYKCENCGSTSGCS
jgi:ribonucleoside-diphosphate reductase alpha chain